MNQELKDLLKPPFRYDCGTIFDSNNQIFCRLQLLLPGLGEITAKALTEKWEKYFSEPLYWRIKYSGVTGNTYICPKCGTDYDMPSNFCCCCGQPLKFPLKESEEKIEVEGIDYKKENT